MMHNLFGTDGIRQPVGVPPFTDAGLERLGKALSAWIGTNFGSPASVLILHDTRQSASWIKSFLKTNLLRNGINVYDGMTLPTPAAYALTRLHPELCASIIISASHNPYKDNGIKMVNRGSHKLTPLDEQHISQLYFQPLENPPAYETFGSDNVASHFLTEYQEYILRFFPPHFLKGIRVVLDCAQGATSVAAPYIFTALGAEVVVIHAEPNGTNINDHCGAVYPEKLQQAVVEHTAAIGFAFDGDGDRLTVVTKNGSIKDGDDVLAFLINHPQYHQQTTIVGTVMTNYGLERYLESQQKKLVRTKVGDKHIAEYLTTHHLMLGGEQSGHTILRDYLNTGDGIFTALRILETILLTHNWHLETFTHYPQITISVPIAHKKDLTLPELATLIENHQNQLRAGRVLVRYSGTESVLRVMVEDENLSHAQEVCQSLSSLLQKELL